MAVSLIAIGDGDIPGMDSDTAREVLPALIRTNVGTTNADGSVTVLRRAIPDRFLYGPYWRLNRGTYRLEFACDVADIDHVQDDFMGVEVVAQNRFLLAVADFRQGDLSHGKASVTFRVADEFARDLANDAMIEFRFLHYGAATFSITSVTLCPQESDADDGDSDEVNSEDGAGLPKWRLASRLRHGGAGRSTRRGVRFGSWISRASVGYRAEPTIPLPCGQYRLSFDVTAGRFLRAMDLEVGVAVSVGNTRLATQSFGSADLDRSGLALGFSVPPDQALEHAADDELTIEFWKSGSGGIAVSNIELAQVGTASDAIARTGTARDTSPGTPSGDALTLPGIVGKAPVRIVIVGNCQAEVLTAGIRNSPDSDRIRAKYHAAALPKNLAELARADVEACDIFLAQDIGDFENYPLKDALRADQQVHRFPILMFATPWPFDSMSGLPDRLAQQREMTEPMFPNLDGGLARLRREIPDHEARFLAYRALAFEWPVDLGRLASFEERRLLAMDGKFGTDIGARILENFRLRQEFHSVGHPGDRLFGLLLDHICRVAALGKIRPQPGTMDALRNVQIPVHPLVAGKLGIEWADERTLYEFRGVPTTWEAYVRRYIHHFG